MAYTPTSYSTSYSSPRKPKQRSTSKSKRFGLGVLVFALLLVCIISVDPGRKYVAAAVKPNVVVPSQSICLDPGHGGDDPGAINGDLTEAATNLTVAKLVRSALEAKGYGVYMTRTTDVTLTNADRVNYCNAKSTTILISIHQNAYTDNSSDYSTALYYKPQDIELANTLANAAGQELDLSITPPMEFDDGMLERAHMPSIIIESYFITNVTEANAMHSNNARIDQQVVGIENGIGKYLQAKKPVKPAPTSGNKATN